MTFRWGRRAALCALVAAVAAALLAAALVALWVGLSVVAAAVVGATVLLRELVKHFYATLLVLSLIWAASRLWPRPWLKVVAAACVPWIIGMGSLAVIVQGTRLLLPAADWPLLFRIQTFAGSAQAFLKAVTPGGWITQLSLTFVALALGLGAPGLAVWVPRVKKALSWSGKVAAVLAVFTTYSFFGTAYGASAIVQFTKEEGKRRVHDDAQALAEQQIATRIRQDPAAEARALNQYFAAIVEGVRVQKAAEALAAESPMEERARLYGHGIPHGGRPAGGEPVPAQPLTKADGARVQTRVAQLAAAIARSHVVQAAGARVTGAIEGLVGRPLTQRERGQAHEALEKSVGVLIGKAAELAGAPLLEGLQGEDGAELAPKIAKDLYAKQVERATEPISAAMADAFLPAGGPVAAGVNLPAPPDALEPAFRAEAIPRDVLHPDLAVARQQLADKRGQEVGRKIKELLERFRAEGEAGRR
jgi:hypothetical protein